MMQKQRDLRKARKFGQKEGYDKARAEFKEQIKQADEQVKELNKQKKMIIKELAKRGMSIEDIAKIVRITTEEVRKITASDEHN